MKVFLPLRKNKDLSLRKFIVGYLLYTLLLAAGAVAINYFFPVAIASSFWVIFGFIAIITFAAYLLAYFGMKRNPERGVVAILGSIMAKMLFAMCFVLIYSVKRQENNMAFALNFFSLYLLFTLFEILSLLRNLRHQNK